MLLKLVLDASDSSKDANDNSLLLIWLLYMYKAYIRPKLEYNSHIWAGAPVTYLSLLDRVQRQACRLIDDQSICSQIPSLEHRRNVGCLALLYRYFHHNCSDEIYSCVPPVRQFNRNTRAASSAHPYVLKPIFGGTVKFRSSFFNRSTRMWNDLPSSVFPETYNLQRFKISAHRHLSLFPFLS